MTKEEPPSTDKAVFLVGRNGRGQWVAQESNGLSGGLFINRAAAVSFAMFETGHDAARVIAIPGILELQIPGIHPSPPLPATAANPAAILKAA